jgi:hypothetical protein
MRRVVLLLVCNFSSVIQDLGLLHLLCEKNVYFHVTAMNFPLYEVGNLFSIIH